MARGHCHKNCERYDEGRGVLQSDKVAGKWYEKQQIKETLNSVALLKKNLRATLPIFAILPVQTLASVGAKRRVSSSVVRIFLTDCRLFINVPIARTNMLGKCVRWNGSIVDLST